MTGQSSNPSSIESATDEKSPSEPLRWAVAEGVLILLLFLLFAGGPPPDTNEAHYLAKARHYWNPSWCPRDFFLRTKDAHQVFYWTIGWLTLWLPLSAVAWVGRAVTWALMACAWQRLSWALVPRRFYSLVSAALFLGLNQRCHMAGEWVVGGVEAKCIAYAFVWLAVAQIVNNRWRRAWLLLGVASAFHVLVGGWSVVAAGIAWLAIGKSRPPLREQVLPLAGGMLLSLPGLIPALLLTSGVERQLVATANEIYLERLPHHLVLHEFHWPKIAAHIGLLLVWLGLARALLRDARQRKLQGFVLGAVLIALTGTVLDVALWAWPNLAAAVLRYYWFRLSDAILPVGVALGLLGWLTTLGKTQPIWSQRFAAAAILLSGLNMAVHLYGKRLDNRPGADIQSLPRSSESVDDTEQIYRDWRAACQWIAENTPPDALFLTPRRQQTFIWYASRGEVFCWKDVPQDAAGLVEWRDRRDTLFPVPSEDDDNPEHDLLRHSDAELYELCRQYNARYLVIDLTRSSGQPDFTRVFPVEDSADDETPPNYEVYDVLGPAKDEP